MLALVGSGEYLPPMEPVDQYLLSLLDRPANVVCLPTAAGLESSQRIRYWMDLGVKHFTRLGGQVEALKVVNRQDAENPAHAERVKAASFVYLSGGKPEYLYQTLVGTPVWDAIHGVHRAGGVVAGCSAGAMIMGERIPGFPGSSAGFNLLPGTTIVPHFDEIPSTFIQTARLLGARNLTLLGIDGDTALVVHSERWEVCGSGGVTVWGRETKKRYLQGEPLPII